MDWITLSVEVVGIAILVIWTIVPIGEFRLIFRRLKDEKKFGAGGKSGERR